MCADVMCSGLDFIEKKTGHTMGRDTNEKITDGARGMFEKMTRYVYFLSIHHIFPLTWCKHVWREGGKSNQIPCCV